MSFILDALKKAESERSRSAGPVLMDVRVVAQRQRLPAWAWALGCVLLANLLVLGWLLWRKNEPAAPVAAPTQQAAALLPVPPAAQPPAVILQPAMEEPALAAPAAASAPVPAMESASLPAPSMDRVQRAAPAPVLPLLPRVDNLPTAQDLVAEGVSLPALQLLLLAYDGLPANRYVLLNGRRLREGDEVAEGIRLESIVPTGVVLNARGRRFVLLAGS
jgi:general secretion pathway protein B